MQILSSAQCRAARALLDWSQADLAEKSGIHIQTISNFEKDAKIPSKRTLSGIVLSFQQGGIEFYEDGGLRPQQAKVKVLRGKEGFSEFYDDIYLTIREKGGEILISNADEKTFWKWMGGKKEIHKERMSKLSFSQKIIVKDGITNIRPAYKTTTYRLLPKEQFSGVPFYLYGNKLAIINFEPTDVQVFIIEQHNIAKAYETTFRALWSICRIPDEKEIQE